VPRRRPAPTVHDVRQGELLAAGGFPVPGIPAAIPVLPGAFACADLVAEVLTRAIADSGRSRADVAAWMTSLSGTPVSVAMLNAWTAKSHGRHRFPFELAGAFCKATGSNALLDLLAQQLGARAIDGPDLLDLEAGRLARVADELDARRRRVRELQRRAV
jgi:hypothetical protein